MVVWPMQFPDQAWLLVYPPCLAYATDQNVESVTIVIQWQCMSLQSENQDGQLPICTWVGHHSVTIENGHISSRWNKLGADTFVCMSQLHLAVPFPRLCSLLKAILFLWPHWLLLLVWMSMALTEGNHGPPLMNCKLKRKYLSGLLVPIWWQHWQRNNKIFVVQTQS